MNVSWKLAILCAGIGVASGLAVAWQFGAMETKRHGFAIVAKDLQMRAEKGDVIAQTSLADLYLHGQGVNQDFGEAFRWYQKAAYQDRADAEESLAEMYYRGQGVAQDYSKAVEWSRKAAIQGNAKAEFSLGSEFYIGKGVPKDYAEAMRWYRKAADQGFAKAQYGLGYMYYYGQGVPPDRAQALSWFHMAADQGDEDARRALGIRNSKMSKRSNVVLFVVFMGSSLLLIGSMLPSRHPQNSHQMAKALTGLLGLSYVGFALYGLSNMGNVRSMFYICAFNCAKNFFAGSFTGMFVSIYWSKIARSLLITAFGFFLAFDLYFLLRENPRGFAGAAILFTSVNGLVVGFLCVLAIRLSLIQKAGERLALLHR